MFNTNQIKSEISFEWAELEFQLFISKFQVEVPTNWILNKFHSISL